MARIDVVLRSRGNTMATCRIVSNPRWWLVALVLLGSCGDGAGEPADDVAPAAVTPSPARVVSLVPSLAEIVIAMGARDALVARTDYETHPLTADLPSIGGGLDPDLESIVGLGIDLVLIPDGRDSPAVAERLAALDVETLTIPTQAIDDIYRATALLGRRLGRVAQADSLEAWIRDGLAEVEASVAGRPPVDVVYVVWPDPPMTTGGGTFIDEVIRLSGGRNVFFDSPIQWPTVGFEAIVDRAPEVIIWPRGEGASSDLAELVERPGWRDVPAAQAESVVVVDSDLFNRPGPGVVAAARDLARKLHPDAF